MSKVRLTFPRFNFRVYTLDNLFRRVVSRFKSRLLIFLRSGSWINVDTRSESRIREEALRAQVQQRKNSCRHRDRNSFPSLGLNHNFPDGQVRGICVLCNEIIHPREWRIGAPSVFGVPQPYIVEAHKDYGVVLNLESMDEYVGVNPSAAVPKDEYAEELCKDATPSEIVQEWKSQQTDPQSAFMNLYSARTDKVLE
jgi:hypothetical protein